MQEAAKIDHALRYAARGWQVMPLHTVRADGSCTCNSDACTSVGKHPRTMRGLKDATTDADQVKRWWSMWPDANIGVTTGHESGIVVLDIDDESAGGLQGRDKPHTTTQETGSGGKHLIYAHPGDGRVKTTVQVVPGVDSRADGGYIVVPPSNHRKGVYRWTVSPDQLPPQPAPAWWIELLRQEAKTRTGVPRDGERIYAGGRNATLASIAGSMRRNGLGFAAINAALLQHNSAACDPPLEEHEVELIARSISGYQIETEDERDKRVRGGGIAARLLRANDDAIARSLALDRKQIETAGPPPANFVPGSGLIKDVVDYILSTSVRPQPIFATLAACSLIATLGGRRYSTETNLRTNMYYVIVAQSGHGKDAPRKAVKRILSRLDGGMALLGGDRIRSGPALISALEESPTRLYLLDEFGDMLGAMTGTKRDNGYQREVVTNLMQLYTDAGSVFNGSDYANRKERKQTTIYDPCLVVYATSSPTSFYGALSSSEGASGALARMLVVDTGSKRPERQRQINMEPPPDTLIKRLEMVRKLATAGNLVDSTALVDTSQPRVVPMTPQVTDAWHNLDDSLTDRMTSDIAASIYSRVAEQTAKLALIYSIGKDVHSPIIDEEAFAWARDIALWSANLIMEQLAARVADTDAERTAKEIEQAVLAGGAAGKTKSELNRVLTKIRPYEQSAYLTTLVDNGILFEGKRPTGGRPAHVYVAAKYYDEAKKTGVVDTLDNDQS